jgi:hypothetical protein
MTRLLDNFFFSELRAFLKKIILAGNEGSLDEKQSFFRILHEILSDGVLDLISTPKVAR